VLKLYRTLRKTEKTTPRQMVFYDPGVGTLARPNAWKKLVQDASAIFGLATGYGLRRQRARFLRIHSSTITLMATRSICSAFPQRRLHRARAGGPDHKIGLISKQQVNLAGSG